jgi:hypothetical protein
MALSNWAFIYLGSEIADPAVDRAVIECGGVRTTIVAVPQKSAAVAVACDLVATGVQAIELCGAFGPEWTKQVIDATRCRIPVGSVMYTLDMLTMNREDGKMKAQGLSQ